MVASQSVDMSAYILQSESDASESLAIEDVQTLPDLLQHQAERLGDATLFSFRPQLDCELTTLSYIEAYSTSCALGRALGTELPSSGTANAVVGIWLERSIDLHLAILATTVSGAAWLPFDADVPHERVNACLQDSNASILLCDKSHHDVAMRAVDGLPQCQVVTLEELYKQAKDRPEVKDDIRTSQPQDTAYIIYTSGSSGTPKGIAISHHAALMFCLSERTILATDLHDIVWQGFSAAFDMFIEET